MNEVIITPDHPDFWSILHSSPPPNWRNNVKGDIAYIAPDNNGILQIINSENLEQYEDENQLKEDDEGLWLPSWMTWEYGTI